MAFLCDHPSHTQGVFLNQASGSGHRKEKSFVHLTAYQCPPHRLHEIFLPSEAVILASGGAEISLTTSLCPPQPPGGGGGGGFFFLYFEAAGPGSGGSSFHLMASLRPPSATQFGFRVFRASKHLMTTMSLSHPRFRSGV